MKQRRSLFSAPVIIPVFLLVLGCLVQLFVGEFNLVWIEFPVNAFIALQFLVVVMAASIFLKNSAAVAWFGKSGAAISSTVFFAFCVMLMAIIPQTGQPGFQNIAGTWCFVFSVGYWLTALTFVVSKRMRKLNLRNLFFVMQHLGLLIAVLAGVLGQADKQQAYLRAWRNQIVWYADEKGETIELPFAVELNEFTISYHTPQLALVNAQGALVSSAGDCVFDAVEGNEFIMGKFQIHVDAAYSRCYIVCDSLIASDTAFGAVSAASVSVKTKEGTLSNLIVSPGNYSMTSEFIMLGADSVLVMLPPEPESFKSIFKLYKKSDLSVSKVAIEVNKPAKAEGWTIYQHGYDNNMGNDSQYSDFMIVKDPWLPVVYCGIVMILIGAIGLFFYRPKKRSSL